MKGNKQIAFIGDSLTEYFDWQSRFPEYHVMNLGIAGETVDGLLDRIDKVISSIKEIDCIFVMTGINNIAMEDFDILESYKEIICELTTRLKDAVIVVQSLLPVKLHWIDNGLIKAINSKLKEIALGFNAEYLDIFSLFVDSDASPRDEYLLEDGVHLSDKGYGVWAGAVERFINKI